MNAFDARPAPQPEAQHQPTVGWTPIEVIDAQWEKITAPRRERERLEAEQRKAEALRQAEIAKLKDVLPYSDDLAQEICERIAIGELLINVCADEHLPSQRRCNQWLRANAEFNTLYQSALNDRLSVFEEEIIKIADDASKDFKMVLKGNQEKRIPDTEQVARAKLRIDVRFRHLKAYRQQRWGDASTVTLKDGDSFDTSSMDIEALEREIADIGRKDGIVRMRKDRAA